MSKITPFLWFDRSLEEVVQFYASVFPNAKITHVSGQSASFVLEGQEFMALNGGPMFKFNESVSFFVACETQKEVDYFWSKLTADGGEESRCGWLKDKYGLSWQIIPSALIRGLSDPAKAGRVSQAMMQMKKIDVAAIEKAAAG